MYNTYSHFNTDQIKEMIDKIFATKGSYTIQNFTNPIEAIYHIDKCSCHIAILEAVVDGFSNGYSDVPESHVAYYLGNEAVKLAAVIGDQTRRIHYWREGNGTSRESFFTVYDAIKYVRANYPEWLTDKRIVVE